MGSGTGSTTAETGRLSLERLAAIYERIVDDIENADELSLALIEEFNAIKGSMATKVDNWISYLEFLDREHDGLKATIDRLRKKQVSVDNHRHRLKSYLIQHIAAHPDLPFKGEQGKLSVRKNPPTVLYHRVNFRPRMFERIIEDNAIGVPTRFLTTHTITILNHDAVKQELQKGESLPFAELTYGQHLRIT